MAQLLDGTIDVAATDVPLPELRLGSREQDLVAIPSCRSTLALAYNLPITERLRLTPDLIAALFAGRLTSWSAPPLIRVNSAVPLPSLEVAIVHRSDRSGTTFIFTDFLTRSSSEWARAFGRGSLVHWPSGLGVERNERLVELLARVPGAIGYTPPAHADSVGLPAALVDSGRGEFLPPTGATADRYPIMGLSYLVVFRDLAHGGRSRERALALSRFLWWAVHEGQRRSPAVSYLPLPAAAVAAAEQSLGELRYGEEALLPALATPQPGA
jgi:phosphate transport system substrate-binding protein